MMTVYTADVDGFLDLWCPYHVQIISDADLVQLDVAYIGTPPWDGLKTIAEGEAWCMEHFGPRVVEQSRSGLPEHKYELYPDHRWDRVGWTFLFADLAEATLFKLRWYKS